MYLMLQQSKLYIEKVHESFREAAVARNLLYTDSIVYEIFDEAAEFIMPDQLGLFYCDTIIIKK